MITTNGAASRQTVGASGADSINFVTRSLGGILVRYLLQNFHVNGLGKIVMLSPPNHGSEVADTLKDWAPCYWAVGTPGQQPGTGEDDIAKTLKPIPGDIGIITGDVSYDPWVYGILPGQHDCKVTVESANLDEMKDFLVVQSGHTFIVRADACAGRALPKSTP